MNIFVGSLSFKTTEDQLHREFEAYGEVESVKVIIDRETLKSRGFAFVEMSDKEQATAAIAGMNGKLVDGFTLKVNEAKPREARSGGQNRERSGGYGGGGYGGGDRSSGGYGGGGGRSGGGGGYNSFDRSPSSYDTKDKNGNNIYDTKGGSGNRGRGGSGGHGSGGRSGGGRKSY
jgi:cold-inducible RNA-binding protein